jgi:metallo-beta-lactamase class B
MRSYAIAIAVAVGLLAQPVQAQNWNRKAPWGGMERSFPTEAQKKAPYKIFDNAYYVGIQSVCAYLITTSDGLVLIDATFPDTGAFVVDNVRKLGFDPASIKYILITHGHFDHVGGVPAVKKAAPGARVAMSAEDWRFAGETAGPRDLMLKDGDTITVGESVFKFYLTPGHTPGSMSIEYQVKEGGKSYRALSPGGLGLNYGPEWNAAFVKSVDRLKQLGPWDTELPNHPWLGPRDMAEVEKDLARRGSGPNPALFGAASIRAFFDAVGKVAREKLAAESASAR